ncbi:hypothetical protein R6Z02_16305 [Carnobacterium maltaromaticum]|uniref:hypothetical protein n=1 Tax=Carnobacterium maltaromaticum TaxID=2751 RepID=UPI00298A7AB1|nr:hypothetical protein [Carnobacterium maltaromaticum]MDW5525302.1 hypothetical protein [Carnobacterium maltaromaticum]
MKKRFNVLLTGQNYQKLMKRVNYLASTRTSVILLSLFLYQDSKLNEKQIRYYLEQVRDDNEKEKFYFEASPYLVNTLKNKKRYLYSLDEYVTAILNFLLEDEQYDWEEADEKQEKVTSIYTIDKNLAKWLDCFSSKSGISQTTLLNYSFMNAIANFSEIDKTNDRIKKGFFLTQSSLNYFETQPEIKKAAIIENHIKELQKLEK